MIHGDLSIILPKEIVKEIGQAQKGSASAWSVDSRQCRPQDLHFLQAQREGSL